MKSIFLCTATLVATLLFSACSKNDSATPQSGDVLFINACTNVPFVDVKLNGTITTSTLQFLTATTSYQRFTGGNVTFFKSGADSILSKGEAADLRSHYSCILGGSLTDPSISFITDDLTPPHGNDSIKIRFINLSPDSLRLNCFANNILLSSNVNCFPGTNSTEFHVIKGGTMPVLMQDNSLPSKNALLMNQYLPAGHIYTVLFTGSNTGSVFYRLSVITNI